MLTRKTAVLAFGALALSPSPNGVESFTSSGRPTVRRSGSRGGDGPTGQRRSSGMRSILTTSSPKTRSLPLPLLQSPSPSYSCSLPGNTLGRRSSGNNRVSSLRTGSQRDRKLQLYVHKQQQQQQQQQEQMQIKGQRRRRRRGASLTKVGMALSTGAPSSTGVTSLDDHSYVAGITGGVPDFMEAMEQSLSGDLVTVVTYMPWCRSCHHLRHHLRMIAKAYAIAGSGSMFYEIDLDANREVHKMLDINAAPTILLYSSGQLVDEFTCAGATGPKVLLRHIEEQIGAVPALRDVDTSSPAPASPTPGTTGDIPLNSNTENAEH